MTAQYRAPVPLGTKIPPWGEVVGYMSDSGGRIYVMKLDGDIALIDEESIFAAVVDLGAEHPISTGGLGMTDEQILKRLAEIEGWEIDEDGLPYEEGPILNRFRYPLTNWSDLGPLIEKYKIGVDWLPSDLNAWDEERGLKWEAEIWDYSDPEKYKWVCSAQDESLPHAICRAIIEACKDQV